jgi:hypothetical protein
MQCQRTVSRSRTVASTCPTTAKKKYLHNSGDDKGSDEAKDFLAQQDALVLKIQD